MRGALSLLVALTLLAAPLGALPEGEWQKANRAYQEHSYRPALDAYRRFLRQAKPSDPRRHQASLQVARCLESLKEPEREREWLEEWLSKAPPGLPAARGWLMRAKLEQDQLQRGNCYTRVIKMLEKRDDGLSELVQAYIGRANCRGKSASVERDLRSALALDPAGRSSARAFLDLANHYRYQQDSPIRALEILHELAVLRPGTPEGAEALLEEARIFDELERYPEALETIEQLLSTTPSLPAAREGAELREEIRSPWLELVGAMLTSSEQADLSLRSRNLEQVVVAVYRVDLVQLLRQEGHLEPARLPVSGRPLTEQKLSIQPRAPHARYEARLPIPLQKTGAYLVQARSGARSAAALLVRSDLRFFQGGGQVLWLVDSRTGRPVSRAEVWQAFLGERGYEQIRPAALLEGGLVALDSSARPGLVLARVGDEYAWAELEGTRQPGKEGFVFTDRPLYRPGQKVHYQAILRTRLGGDALRAPAGESFRVQLVDPGGNRLLDLNRESGPSGLVSGEVALTPEAAQGLYRLELLQNGWRCAGGSFRVEEARKADFELTIEASREHYQDAQTAELTVSARYPTGQPVARGELRWRAKRRELLAPAFSAPGLEWFPPGRWPVPGGALVAEGRTSLDGAGRARVRLPIRLDQPLNDALYRYTVEAEVRERGRSQSASTRLLASTRSAFLTVRSQRVFWSSGSEAELEAAAVDVLGRPISLKATWVLSRLTQSGRFEQQASGPVELKQGRGRFQWRAGQPGSYRVELQARDQEGQPIRAAGTFQVGEEGRLFQYGGVQVVSDREQYNVGDLAELVITTNQPAMDVLLLLGESRRMVVRCPQRLMRIQLPIGADLAPSFSLRAVAMQNGAWLEYEREVLAANTPGVLSVRVQPTPDQKPDEEGQIELFVSDAGGAPVAGADVTVAVVDASVFRAQGPESLVRAFFGRRNGFVMQKAVHFSPDAPPRELLPETALFRTVRTGPDGTARVKVTYPDSLTTWRVVARAFTADSRFGQAEAEVVVSKDLLVRLDAPRFLIERDEATVAVLVENNLDQAQQAEVSMQAEGGSPVSSPERQLSVAGRSRKGVDFPVSVSAEGWLVLTALARAPLESDAFKSKIPILPLGTVVQRYQSGSFRRQATIELKMPADRNPRSARLEVRLATTLAGPLLGAIEHLSDSPYASVEQTVSRFVPAACLARALKDVDLPGNELARRVPQLMQVGLSRLASFQHADGGWGWWKEDPTDPLMTAYVVHGLTLARQAGYQVSDPMLTRGRNYLRRQIDQLKPDEAAWALLALSLSEQAPEAALERAYQGRSQLGLKERFLLACGLCHQGRAEEARSLLQEAETSRSGDSFSEDVETNAAALMACTAIDPEGPLVAGLTRWLLDHREGSGWGSTRSSAMTLLALVEPLRREKKRAPLRYGLFLNGSEVDTRTVPAQDWWKEQTTRLKGEQVPGGDLKLEIVAQGDVTGSWSTVLRYTSNEENSAPSGDLKVARRYYRLANGRSEPLRSGKAVRLHDEIVVVLDLESSRALDYLVLEDDRPAGCEVVGLSSGLPYGGLCSNVEVRDERTAFFIAHLKPGKSQLSYRMKAVFPGRFHALPTRLYGMYAPELKASSAGQRLEVLP